MTDVNCPVCEDVLEEVEPGVEGLHNDEDDITNSFVVRKFKCNNDVCPLKGKHLDVFFDYTRTEHMGNELDFKALKDDFLEM